MIQDNPVVIAFGAKWVCKVIDAVLYDGAYQYEINQRFIPVNEVCKPYALDHLSDDVARKVLHGSTASNLIPAFNGFNLDLSVLAIDAGVFTERFFLTQAEKDAGTATTTHVIEGDSVLVLIPQE